MVVPPTIPGVSGYVDTTVSITSATGASAVAYTTLDGSTAFTFPATVSSPTTFYLPYTGTFTVSALIGSQQVATTAYTAATVSAINSAAAVVVECAAPRDNQEELSSRFGTAAVGGLAPKGRVRARRDERVITSFASGHGWTNPLPGTLTDDTATYLSGTQSVRLDVTNSSAAAEKAGLGLDMTGRYFGLWVKVADLTTLDQINIYAGPSGLSAYWVWTLLRGTSTYTARSGEWVLLAAPWPGTVVGSPTRSAIDTIRVRAAAKSGQTISVNVDKVVSFPEPSEWPSGVCSIMFDDGKSSQYTAAKTMAKYGFSATIGIIPDSLDEPTFITSAQLREMVQMYGWEVVVHGEPTLPSLSASELTEELASAKQYLIDNGFAGPGIDHYTYPGGQNNAAVITELSKTYVSARTAYDVVQAETWPPTDRYKIRCIPGITSHAGGVTPSAVASAVTLAMANKWWIILVFHNVVSGSTTATTEITQADFETVLAGLVTAGIPVVPYTEVLARL